MGLILSLHRCSVSWFAPLWLQWRGPFWERSDLLGTFKIFRSSTSSMNGVEEFLAVTRKLVGFGFAS